MKKLLIAIIVFALVLGACSQKATKKPKTIKNKLSKGKEIVYIYNAKSKNIKKSDKVEQILYANNGKGKSYDVEKKKLTLNNLSKKSDKEILEIAKKSDKKAFYSARDSASEMQKIPSGMKAKEQHKSKKETFNAIDNDVAKMEHMSYKKPEYQKLKFSPFFKNNKVKNVAIKMPEAGISKSNLLLGMKRKDTIQADFKIFNHELKSKKINHHRYAGLQQANVKHNQHLVVKLKDDESKVTLGKAKSDK